jgi:hypothetical protein
MKNNKGFIWIGLGVPTVALFFPFASSSPRFKKVSEKKRAGRKNGRISVWKYSSLDYANSLDQKLKISTPFDLIGSSPLLWIAMVGEGNPDRRDKR